MEDFTTKTERTEAFWADFCQATGVEGDYDAVAFGDSVALANELAELVLTGPKRATAGLLRDYEADGDPLPIVGGYVVMTDGHGEPKAVWQTTDVRVGPLSSVDDKFAWDEGEGDRTRADWLRMHTNFFTRQAEAEGFDFHPDIETVFERFKIVWPPEHAD